MKKAICAALVLGFLAGATGCGKSKEEVAAEAATKRATELAQAKAIEEAESARRQTEEEEAKRQEELARQQAEQQAEQQRQQEELAKTEALQGKVRALLKDPASAQFQNLRITPYGALCGEVNAKNGFGGYVGFKPFVATDEKAFIDGNDALEHLVYEGTARNKGC